MKGKPIYEPMKQERFLVIFPEGFEVRHQYVTLSSTATGRLFNSNMVKSELVNGYTEVKMKFYDTISFKMAHQLINMRCDEQLFDFTIESLEPTGVITNKWLVTDATIKKLHFDEINENEGWVDVKITLVPNGFTLLK